MTDDDNGYRGLRLLVDAWIDLYQLENASGDEYLWLGIAHVHIIFWAPRGTRA